MPSDDITRNLIVNKYSPHKQDTSVDVWINNLGQAISDIIFWIHNSCVLISAILLGATIL